MKIGVVAFCVFVVFCLSVRLPWQFVLVATAVYVTGESLWQMFAWAHSLQVNGVRAVDMLVRVVLLVALWLGQMAAWLGLGK